MSVLVHLNFGQEESKSLKRQEGLIYTWKHISDNIKKKEVAIRCHLVQGQLTSLCPMLIGNYKKPESKPHAAPGSMSRMPIATQSLFAPPQL